MTIIKIKGHSISLQIIQDSHNRRAIQYRNNIFNTLRKIGIRENNINIQEEAHAIKTAPAFVSWYMDGHHMYYSYKLAKKYVENLFIVSKIIDLEVNALLSGQKTMEEFMSGFSEGHDVEEQRQKARIILGVDEETTDMNIIDEKYKALAKKNHPDMPNGNTEKFKEINNAHKILKRELQ